MFLLAAEFLPDRRRGIPLSRNTTQDREEVTAGMGFEEEGMLARATVDTTLAVIPAEAFRKLTKKFPQAAAHIVQGM